MLGAIDVFLRVGGGVSAFPVLLLYPDTMLAVAWVCGHTQTHAHICACLHTHQVCEVGVVQSYTLCCPFCVLLHNCTVMSADWFLDQCLDGGSSC